MRLWCVMKNGFYMTTGDNQLSSWMKKKLQSTFQSQTCTQIRSCRCLVVCCPFDPLKHAESWRNHYIWEVCSANWWDALKTATPAASSGQQKGPNSSSQQHQTKHYMTNISKVERIGLQIFASSTIFTWPPADQLPLPQASWQLFAGKILSQLQDVENVFLEFTESHGMVFYATGISKLISHWQKCAGCNGSYSD